MNILFKRKKPVDVQSPYIPPKPERFRKAYLYEEGKLFRVKNAELNSGKVFYPIGQWFNDTVEYFTTKIKAQAECDKLNIPIKRLNKKMKAQMVEKIAIRNKEIADWDKKYNNKQEIK